MPRMGSAQISGSKKKNVARKERVYPAQKNRNLFHCCLEIVLGWVRQSREKYNQGKKRRKTPGSLMLVVHAMSIPRTNEERKIRLFESRGS